MANKFEGTIEELQALVKAAGIKGKWEDDGQGKHTFRSSDGGVLNWWTSRGTVQLQGQDKAKQKLEKAIAGGAELTTGQETQPAAAGKQQPKHIFIVHGHDSDARDQLELALHRLGLKPFILMNSSGGGKTIIEALEGQIGRDYTSDFGIVLMTPDDFGYAKKDGDKKVEPRARQNVILEAGMLLASLTRVRMAIIVKGHLEMPSDLQGIIHLAYNDHVKEIIPKLCQRLKEAGFDLEPNQIAAAAQ
ncbi:MAG TPA: nucleotide-binding protein [Verrucomicrobiae bacterium]|nr:nucleotide-binding protein [Verrucomicrobiae bacterium]